MREKEKNSIWWDCPYYFCLIPWVNGKVDHLKQYIAYYHIGQRD